MIKTTPEKYYQITSTDSKRINVLKVWFTFMVVFIHSYSEGVNLSTGSVGFETPYWLEILKYTISQCISRCAVPGFFLISAILLYRKPFLWSENIRKKIKTLLVPYVLVNSLWIMVYFICQHIQGLSVFFSNESNIVANWKMMDWLQAYGVLGGYPLVYPLWFIRNLIVLNVLAPIIKKVVEKFPYPVLFLLLAVWVLGNNSFIVQSICFWGLGCFIVCRNIKISVADKINKYLLCIIYIFMMAGDVLTRGYVWHNIVHNIGILTGIVFWFVCCTEFAWDKWNRLLLFICSYCFNIYLFHELSLSFLQKISARLFPVTTAFQLLEYLLIPVVIVVGILIFSVIFEKMCPRLYSVVVGKRRIS